MYETDYKLDIAVIEAESIGCIPLEEGVYLHVSDENATEVMVVGLTQDRCRAQSTVKIKLWFKVG